MAVWVAPRTWASEQVTASLLDVEVRDNMQVLYDDRPRQPWDNPQGMTGGLMVTGATVGANNNCHYQRIYGGALNTTARYVRFQVGTSSGTVGVAIYASSGSGITATLGTRLATSGSIACPASGSHAIVDLGTTVTAVGQGTHWLGFSASTTVMTFIAIGSTTTTTRPAWPQHRTTAHPPPTTPVPTATTATNVAFVLNPA